MQQTVPFRIQIGVAWMGIAALAAFVLLVARERTLAGAGVALMAAGWVMTLVVSMRKDGGDAGAEFFGKFVLSSLVGMLVFFVMFVLVGAVFLVMCVVGIDSWWAVGARMWNFGIFLASCIGLATVRYLYKAMRRRSVPQLES